MTPIQQLMLGAGGKKDLLYVDDVFSTHLYSGSGSAKTITTGVDLTNKGGMTWIKSRNHTYGNKLADTVRGNTKVVDSGAASSEHTETQQITSWSSTGFVLGTNGGTNNGSYNYASWSFAKQKGFFDVVSWTGNGTAGRTVSHSLDSVPGMIMVKCTSHDEDWAVYHVELGNTKYLKLNGTNGADTNSGRWNDTSPTSSVFTLGDSNTVNGDGKTYIAYLFASLDNRFGDDTNGYGSIVKCGTYTGNGASDGPMVYITGSQWEPQFLLIKRTSGTENWLMFDDMRTMPTNGTANANVPDFRPDSSNAENADRNWLDVFPNGFKPRQTSNHINGNGEKYVYLAIRRPDGKVGKPVTDPTKVFAIDTGNGSTTVPAFDSGFPVDMRIGRDTSGTASWYLGTRYMDQKHLQLNTQDAEWSGTWEKFDYMLGEGKSWTSDYIGYMWKRHAGFDVVNYKGTGSVRSTNHGLFKTPEMIWVKRRDGTANWSVWHKDLNQGTDSYKYELTLNGYGGETENTTSWSETNAHTAGLIRLGTNATTNASGGSYILCAFASVDGVSKCGSFTGNGTAAGSTQTITTGFQPRFIIIKNVSTANDNNANWIVLDTTRGWASGNDDVMTLNTSNTSGTANFADPLSTGFQVVSDALAVNKNGERYIYYCHG